MGNPDTPPGPVKIDTEGVYTITADAYHSDPVTGGSLSSTGARQLLTCPAKFQHYLEHGRPDTASFSFGRAAHREATGAGADYIVITGTGKDPEAWRTDADRDAVAAAVADGKTPVRPQEAAAIREMAAALRGHPEAGPLFARDGAAEQVLVWRDPETGVWCRAMLDWQPTTPAGSRPIIVDYKTTVDAEPYAFATASAKYGYHQQGDFYSSGLTALGLDNNLTPVVVIVAQEKTAPYLVTVQYCDAEAMEWGRRLNQRARAIYRTCTATGSWPGYSTKIMPLSLPRWKVAEYERLFDDAEEWSG